MIERLIENWLTKSDERSYQIPFVHSLIHNGYKVIHSSRHCPLEFGKDIIAVDSSGRPCAYQLKALYGKKLSLKMFQDLVQQLNSLINLAIAHPGITSNRQHRSILVINDEIQEEAQSAIKQYNQGFVNYGTPDKKLEIISKGDLINIFHRMGTEFWPCMDFADIKTFLNLFLNDGKGSLPKNELSDLFEISLPFKKKDGKIPGKNECARKISGLTLLNVLSINSFSKNSHHSAEFEAWVLYIAYILALAERWCLEEKYFKTEYMMALDLVYYSVERLCLELMSKEEYFEGDAFFDGPVYKVRMTYLLGLMSLLGLWRRYKGEKKDKIDDFIRSFILSQEKCLYLWGEYAIPQFLAYHWYLMTIESTPKPDFQLISLIQNIVKANSHRKAGLLANPYYSPDDIIPYIIGTNLEPLDDNFDGQSYYLESLLHLFVRANWKQSLKLEWSGITKVFATCFKPKNNWEYFFWRCKEGTTTAKEFQHCQKWEDLRALANDNSVNELPHLIKINPLFYLAFLIVYPHRVNSSGIRWFDCEIKKLI